MAAESKDKAKKEHGNEPAPPDGGYGWVVLFSAFLISFILDGVMYSFGLILTQIKVQFNEPTTGNLLNSLNTGFLFCSGPVVAGLTNQFGCRVVVIGGAVITSLMYVLTAFAPNIYIQMITFGVVGGLSTGCTYIASIIIIAHYFDKKRGVATGITMSGSGFGGFAFAPLLKMILDKFDWKFTMVMMACIILECTFLGSLLRPLRGKPSKKANKQLELQNLINEPALSGDKSDPNNSSRPGIQTFSGSTLSLEKQDKLGFGTIALNILKEMTDLSLLKESKPFLLVTLSNFFIFLGYFAPFIYISEFCQDNEIENYAWLLSIIGIVNIPFRMLYGLIADRKIVSAVNLNAFACLVATVPFFFYSQLLSFYTQAIFAIAFAVGIAGLNSLTTMYLIEMVGLKKFNKATGIINLFRGFGCFIGTPIAGQIVTKTGLKSSAFFYSGVLFSIGFVFAALISLSTTINKLTSNKKKKTALLSQEIKEAYVANHINFDNTIHEIDINNGQKFSPDIKNSTGLRALVRCATLSTEAQFVDSSPEDAGLPLTLQECSGSDVDIGLFKCCESIYPKMSEYRLQNRKVYEMPSNKSGSYQLYIYETDDNDRRYLVVMKGPIEIVLQHCSSIFIDGNDIQLDDQWKNQINAIYQELIGENERVMCFADIRLDPKQFPVNYSFDADEIYTFPNLRFLGMVSLVNQRSRVKQLI